jgi:hypothetical protein
MRKRCARRDLQLSPGTQPLFWREPDAYSAGGLAAYLALGGLIGHKPSALELFVELHILRGCWCLLSLSRERLAKAANEAKSTKETHDEPPTKGRMSQLIVSDGKEERVSASMSSALLH